jgi:hypothetical protein
MGEASRQMDGGTSRGQYASGRHQISSIHWRQRTFPIAPRETSQSPSRVLGKMELIRGDRMLLWASSLSLKGITTSARLSQMCRMD